MKLTQVYRAALIAIAGFLIAAAFHTGPAVQASFPQGVRNIVIVHGAWADGSSWSKVIPLLQAKGLHVVAVQNPLTSLADDVAANAGSHSRSRFWSHSHDRRVEDEAILERDCEQRPGCFSRASKGRSGGDEGCFNHRSLQPRADAFSPERSRRPNRASCSESRESLNP